MKEYTLEQRREYARNLPTKELLSLAELYSGCTARNSIETDIRKILDAEVERRINNWEIAEV